MRKRIGGWLVVLASLMAPAAAHAQQLRAWGESPLKWESPAAPPDAAAPAAAADAAPPYTARGQDIQGYYVPPEPFVGPLSHPRYEDGGFYAFAEFLYWRQSRPILSQTVAIRGFVDTNGAITGTPNSFVGSGEEALNTNMLAGQGSWQPGTKVGFGWRFKNGVSVDLEWWHLQESKYSTTAGVIPTSFLLGGNEENTFLFSPVVNFPIAYAGAPANVLVNGVPANGATFGIWNAASTMTQQFVQRFELVQLNARIPVWEATDYRAYGVFGPRAIIMWERYWWRTVDEQAGTNIATNDTTATYTNVVSNRLYGVHCGSGHDWYLGSTPIGAFSIDLAVEGGLYMDFVKSRIGYELGDRSTAATHKRNLATLVPSVEGKVGLMWYPWEAIQVRVGYNVLALFNTVASPRPVDFNFGTINPAVDAGIFRWMMGIDIGVGFVF